MLTREELITKLSGTLKATFVAPPIDDIQNPHYRKLSIEFESPKDGRFGYQYLVPQPYHFDREETEDGDIIEELIYDEWEQDWVDRGRKELIFLYADDLFTAQHHLAFLNGD